jgi:hypothetical protein
VHSGETRQVGSSPSCTPDPPRNSTGHFSGVSYFQKAFKITIFEFWPNSRQFCRLPLKIAKFGDIFPANLPKRQKKKESRSEELSGNYRRQGGVLSCSWVVLVCRMATIPPEVYLT